MTTSPPSGTVSFLLTDVEASTRLWERDGEAMDASLEVHDAIVRSEIDARGGYVFSTAGDSFAAAFPTAEGAVAAAVGIQRRLLATDWPGPAVPVRMGIHTGETHERDGDYFGPVVNRTARIMSAGHGGQVLLSSVSAAGASVELGDLGIHHLEDLDEPEHLFEVRHPDLPRIDRPIRTADVRRHNLPDYLTSFVGREEQAADLADLMATDRLVVLTGAGGTGKTRLAVEAARIAAGTRPDGAWLVELAPVTNPHFIMTTIGETWGLRPGEGATIESVVVRYLWGRTLTLIIDNCEHLLDASAAVIRELLDACPRLSIVATSRESLGIAGETTVVVPALDPSRAVRLFVDRAAGARPGWEPTEAEMEAVTRICTLIDGIPLGLELAAARLRSMSAIELADRLDRSFRIVSGPAKSVLPRHRTLRATIDWSHDLLKPDERAVFRRLAVFLGGFDLDAAEAVCSGGGVEAWDVVDLVDSLVDKSLVIPRHDGGGTTRFRLLEPVRQYAQEQLALADEAGTTAAAHAHHYADLVATAAPHIRGPEQPQWSRRLGVDYDNIRGAFDTLLAAGEVERYLTLGFDLFVFQQHRGMQIEARTRLLAGIEAAPDDIDRTLLLQAWFVVALCGAEITDPGGIDHARSAVAVAETMDDPNALGRARLALAATIRHATSDPEYLDHLVEARRLLEDHPEPFWWEPDWDEALNALLIGVYLPREEPRKGEHIRRAVELFERAGDSALMAASLEATAGLWDLTDDNGPLEANVGRAVEILRELDIPYWLGHALQTLGHLLNVGGRPQPAQAVLGEARTLLEDCGDLNCWAVSTRGMTTAELSLGRHRGPAARMVEVIDHLPVLPLSEIHIPRTLDLCAEILLAAGHHARAAIAFGKALDVPLTRETPFGREAGHDRIRRGLEAAIGADEAARLEAEGAAMDAEAALGRCRDWLAEGAAAD
ncbi:MAG: adenylate/guanylate cyclase domain-containing protein [Acidimicrobiia bacterium]|nr:adenylate/guanylate cyclase domain-containing protein [Acidimicrobiia bacterium]